MIQITDKTKCSGCTACQHSCPVKCIKMKEDFEGFIYPNVEKSKCIECGICEKICPILSDTKQVENHNIVTYALRTKNDNDLMESTSGGFTTPFAKWIFSQNGVVYAATYDDEFNVVHKEFDKYDEEFIVSRGSKYVQSHIGNSFVNIKTRLESGLLVAFIGTPCQVAGLMKFLRKSYENLITVDLVCHGTPSPKLWRKYLKYQKIKYSSDISKINFRKKTYGYHSGTMSIEFKNGKEYTGSARVDYMLKSFFKEISSRPACYECSFKSLERESDFTIYDCWHMGELVSNVKDDDKGYTNVIVRTDKAKMVLNSIKKFYHVYEVDTEKAIKLDGSMIRKSAIAHPQRDQYYIDLDNTTLPKHIDKYIKVSSVDYFIEKCKVIIYSCGLIDIFRKIKKRLNK